MRALLWATVASLASLTATASGCRTYDPVAETPHRTVRNLPEAIRLILAENSNTKVFAVGEYHPTKRSANVPAPSTLFRTDVLPVLDLVAKHLVIESWIDDGSWSAPVSALARQVTLAIDRPQNAALMPARAPAFSSMALHLLQMTPIEQDSLLDRRGRVDFFRLLTTITSKLGETTLRTVERFPTDAVVVYGGALHNDLFPRWPFDIFSYALPLQQKLHGNVVEIDLVVPEIAANNPATANQPWLALLPAAGPDHVVVYQPGPHSYVIITQTTDPRNPATIPLGGLRMPLKAFE
ncbi:MAG TPA: hypothetical protein PLF40_00865 [Kofleriaceae bacterium]|nr:hypothetical protein [Kofleriaceae bacterium]